jgi:hypothetical protein
LRFSFAAECVAMRMAQLNEANPTGQAKTGRERMKDEDREREA